MIDNVFSSVIPILDSAFSNALAKNLGPFYSTFQVSQTLTDSASFDSSTKELGPCSAATFENLHVLETIRK